MKLYVTDVEEEEALGIYVQFNLDALVNYFVDDVMD
jgi:hypothetical protein